MPELGTLQRWMAIVIRHRDNAGKAVRSRAARELVPPSAVTGGKVVVPNDRMTPTQRLQVYNGGYLTRLEEVLESDYEVLLHAVGSRAFFQLALDYVDRHPSRHPNLNRFGERFPEFIATRKGLANRAFLRDLARLERAMSEAFDAPEFESVDMASLAHLTQEQWNDARFEANPSVRVLCFNYPVNTYLQAVVNGTHPVIPGRRRSHLVVYRKHEKVWRLDLPGPAYRILQALTEGIPFGQALARGGNGSLDVTGWFQDWSADGLFSHIRAGS